MKAAIVEEPNVLTVRDIPAPQAGPYAALCEMLYGATCTGTDQSLIAGKFPFGMTYPIVLGHESIGRVIEVGDKVRYLQPGDFVTRVGLPPEVEAGLGSGWGGFSQLGLAYDHLAMKEDGLPESEWYGYRINQVLPAETDPAAATMIITWRETWSYINRLAAGNATTASGTLEGASVLVVGSGGNGLAFASHARNAGAKRIVLVGHPSRDEISRRAGATDYLSYKEEGGLPADDEGFDIIIDAVGNSDSVNRFLPGLKDKGRIGIYGLHNYGAYQLDPMKARGTFTYCSFHYDEEEAHEAVLGFLQSGALDASIWLDLDNPFPLDKIADAFEHVAERRAIKALIRLNDSK